MTVTAIAPTGRPHPLVQAGSAKWLQTMSASKVAASLGLSPWESRFSLWHRMKGLVAAQADNDVKRRGHYLEPAIADWFADEHPEWVVQRTGTWLHADRGWQSASPDRLLTPTVQDEVRLLECKTSNLDYEWGEPGTDQIPVYYRAQILWQLDTLGLRTAHVAVLLNSLTFAEYIVTYDPDEAAWLVAQAEAFMSTLERNERPSLDAHGATFQVLKHLHPDIDDVDVEIPQDLADRYLLAQADCKAADEAKQGVAAEILDRLGSGRRAITPTGERIALRVPGRGDSPPFLRPCPQPKPPATHLPKDPA
jgi:putative phage-type endonuclease